MGLFLSTVYFRFNIFFNEPCLKIKELLEELDNDVEMVEDLLQQQDHKAQTESKQKITHVQ